MNINELASALDKAGARVQDLQEKKAKLAINVVAEPESVKDEDIESVKNELNEAKSARDLAQEALDEARASLSEKRSVKVEPENKDTVENVTDRFVHDFTNMISGTQTGAGNGGLTIPDDIQNTINTLVRQQYSLQNLVNVENVSTESGSRVYEKESDITPLAELDADGATIGGNDDPELTTVKYLIKRYAGITTITNSLLKDTAANILAWLERWIVKKVTVTRNLKIIEALGNAPKKPTIDSFDDIKDLENNTLDPAIEATSSFVTNQSGYNVLSKMKDAEGRYMLQPDVTQPGSYKIDGHPVVRVADRWLPDVSGSHPLYFGDLAQGITLFDRENMSLMSTNVGGQSFETDTTKLRVIDRFDVEVVDDGAWAAASFQAVASAAAGTSASSTTAGQ